MKLELLKQTNTIAELMIISGYRGGMKRFLTGINKGFTLQSDPDIIITEDTILEMRMSLRVLKIRAEKLEEVEWNSNHYTNYSGNIGHGYVRESYCGNHVQRDNLEKIEKLLAVYAAADDAVLTMLRSKVKSMMKIKTKVKVNKYAPTLNIKYKGKN